MQRPIIVPVARSKGRQGLQSVTDLRTCVGDGIEFGTGRKYTGETRRRTGY